MKNLVNNSLSLANGFKVRILFSLKMVEYTCTGTCWRHVFNIYVYIYICIYIHTINIMHLVG